jgi:hypothetical protein
MWGRRQVRQERKINIMGLVFNIHGPFAVLGALGALAVSMVFIIWTD